MYPLAATRNEKTTTTIFITTTITTTIIITTIISIIIIVIIIVIIIIIIIVKINAKCERFVFTDVIIIITEATITTTTNTTTISVIATTGTDATVIRLDFVCQTKRENQMTQNDPCKREESNQPAVLLLLLSPLLSILVALVCFDPSDGTVCWRCCFDPVGTQSRLSN